MTSTTTQPDAAGDGGLLVASQVLNSLTGYDELKIEQNFGQAVENLRGAKFVRALLFGHFLHQGVEARKAYKQVMDMRQADVSDYFADEKEDDGGGSDGDPAGGPADDAAAAAGGDGPDGGGSPA